MITVTYSKGRTINKGNFESLRVDIGITLDGNEGEQDAIYDKLKSWIETRLRKEES